MSRFHHRFTLPSILTLLVLSVVVIVIGFVNLTKDTTMPTSTNASAIGISLNQDLGLIDLHQVQANGVSFVYLKATQGKTYFDDNYLTYRDRVQGTNLAFGSQLYVSNESKASAQFAFFEKKVGNNTGSLPVMLVPAVSDRSKGFLTTLGLIAQKLMQKKKMVIVALNYRYHRYLPQGVQFLSKANYPPDKIHYSFWQYTTTGTIKHVTGIDKNVTMFTYNGTVAQYKQKYGQLTQ